jgi:hypothetical protein
MSDDSGNRADVPKKFNALPSPTIRVTRLTLHDQTKRCNQNSDLPLALNFFKAFLALKFKL